VRSRSSRSTTTPTPSAIAPPSTCAAPPLSLAGYLPRGEPAPHHDLFRRTRDARALRRGDWTYPRATTGAGDALLDVRTDPREQADQSAANPALLAELRGTWESIN
jgi:arylsulfatase A-like enzyme